MTRRGLFTGIGALTLGNLASACSPLGLLNTLGPRDRGARRMAQGLAYGAAARQKFDLYGPAWSEGQPRAPVIVFFYGGGWDSGSRELYGWAAQALASRGFVVALHRADEDQQPRPDPADLAAVHLDRGVGHALDQGAHLSAPAGRRRRSPAVPPARW